MKKVKHYIDIELAKKKIARYSYWSIKDENSIMICSSDSENPNNISFGEHLEKITKDNIDAEVQIKYGTNELSARNNPPFFIKVNETIEWVEPEPEETVSINGVPHKVDRNGNVNINLTTPEQKAAPKVEMVNDIFRQEMDMQLSGLRKEYELKEEKWQNDIHNKLKEQNLGFKEMLLGERENSLNQREQALAIREQELAEKEEDVRDNMKGYLKQAPAVLGAVFKEFINPSVSKASNLGAAEQPKEKEKPKVNRTKVAFEIQEDETEIEVEELAQDIEQEEAISLNGLDLNDSAVEEEEEETPITEINYPMEEEYLIQESTKIEELKEIEKE